MKEEKKGKSSGQITRRKFLKDAGLVVGGATVSSLGIVNACRGVTGRPVPVADNVTGNLTDNASGNTAFLPNTGNKTAANPAANNLTGNVTNPVVLPDAPPPVTKIADTAQAVALELFNPAGNQEITQLFAPRLSTLEGKTVAFLACDPVKWQPHRIFPAIMEELKRLYPTIKFLPMDQFPQNTTISEDTNIKRVADRMPDAVFTGSAG